MSSRAKSGWHGKGREGRADQSHVGLVASDMHVRSSASLIRQAEFANADGNAPVATCICFQLPTLSYRMPGPRLAHPICTLLP